MTTGPVRNRLIVRQWCILQALCASRHVGATLEHLAAAAGVCTRTIRRDLGVLEEVYLPVETLRDENGATRWRLIARAQCPVCGRPRP